MFAGVRSGRREIQGETLVHAAALRVEKARELRPARGRQAAENFGRDLRHSRTRNPNDPPRPLPGGWGGGGGGVGGAQGGFTRGFYDRGLAASASTNWLTRHCCAMVNKVL